MVQVVGSANAVDRMPEKYPFNPVLAPSALAAKLTNQIEDLMNTINILRGASVPQGLSAKNGHRVTPSTSMQDLTPRQLEVVSLIAQGYSNSGIAESLGLSRKTVENYINGMYSELELSGDTRVAPRVQAVLEFIDYTLQIGRQLTPSKNR